MEFVLLGERELTEELELVDLFLDDELQDDNNELEMSRRQYKMQIRIQSECWDDTDFVYRFRISKQTFANVLELIRPSIEWTNPRYVNTYY